MREQPQQNFDDRSMDLPPIPTTYDPPKSKTTIRRY